MVYHSMIAFNTFPDPVSSRLITWFFLTYGKATEDGAPLEYPLCVRQQPNVDQVNK